MSPNSISSQSNPATAVSKQPNQPDSKSSSVVPAKPGPRRTIMQSLKLRGKKLLGIRDDVPTEAAPFPLKGFQNFADSGSKGYSSLHAVLHPDLRQVILDYAVQPEPTDLPKFKPPPPPIREARNSTDLWQDGYILRRFDDIAPMMRPAWVMADMDPEKRTPWRGKSCIPSLLFPTYKSGAVRLHSPFPDLNPQCRDGKSALFGAPDGRRYGRLTVHHVQLFHFRMLDDEYAKSCQPLQVTSIDQVSHLRRIMFICIKDDMPFRDACLSKRSPESRTGLRLNYYVIWDPRDLISEAKRQKKAPPKIENIEKVYVSESFREWLEPTTDGLDKLSVDMAVFKFDLIIGTDDAGWCPPVIPHPFFEQTPNLDNKQVVQS